MQEGSTTDNADKGQDDYRRLDRKAMSSMYIGHVITYAVLLAIVIAIAIFGKGPAGTAYDALVIVLAASMIAILAYLVASPSVYYARYRYKITENKIDIRYGVLILRHILVPIERVHQVQVSRGPINNMLGLAHVNITTAGGVATINYLEVDEAEKIADRLNDLVGAMIRGREQK